MLTDPCRDRLEFADATVSVHHHVPEALGKTDEVPFRIDHDLLDVGGALFQEAP